MGMKHHKQILTCGLPKTGAHTVRATGDDGDLQKGWWLGRTFANNKPRFISKTIDSDEIVIDRATGLMWPKATTGGNNIGRTPVQWLPALVACNAHIFAGYSDWRLPNILELISIVQYEEGDSVFSAEFTQDAIDLHIWTSTVGRFLTTQAYGLNMQMGCFDLLNRGSDHSFRPVRTFVGT